MAAQKAGSKVSSSRGQPNGKRSTFTSIKEALFGSSARNKPGNKAVYRESSTHSKTGKNTEAGGEVAKSSAKAAGKKGGAGKSNHSGAASHSGGVGRSAAKQASRAAKNSGSKTLPKTLNDKMSHRHVALHGEAEQPTTTKAKAKGLERKKDVGEAVNAVETNSVKPAKSKPSHSASASSISAQLKAMGGGSESKKAARANSHSLGGSGAELVVDAVCREVACEGLATSAGYCRLHYIKNWKRIKRKELILKEGKLIQYIEELVSKYPEKYIEVIRQDLASDKDFAKVIADLDIDESVDEFDMEGESLEAVIDTIKRDFDDEGEGGF